MKPYYKYAEDVIDGSIVSGEWIKLAAKRFLRIKDDSRYIFREDKADKVISFFAMLRHFTGKHAGKKFILQPWQQFIIASIYGFYVKDTGKRLVNYVFIEMARKNGKTAFAAGICLYHLVADGESDAEVDLAANSKDQAKIAFKFCKQFSKGLDSNEKYLRPYRDKILYDRMVSQLQVFSADDTKLDGFNASMYLIDEYHAAKNSGLRDVLQSSQAMRENPLEVIITTAGFDKLSPCYEYRTMCTEVLKGLKEDDSLFAAIYELDEGDNWKDESTWAKSSPNYKVTVQSDFMQRQVIKAQNSPSEANGIKTKTFNIWCDAERVWIPEHYLLEASKSLKLEDFKGKDCYVGIDLSSNSDLTCAAFMFPIEDKFYYIVRYYLPEAALAEKRFRELYGEWRRNKLITITPGNVTDYDFILNDLIDASNIVRIQNVAFDQWNASQFVINATDKGIPMEPYSQAIGNFNKPTKEIERLILSGKVVIDNNIINRHCFRNVVIKRDLNGNQKPTKEYEEKKIDGVIAMIEALGIYLASPRYGEFY